MSTRRLARIALSGTQGSGKTTLGNLIAHEFGLEALTASLTTRVANEMGFLRASDIPQGILSQFQWMSLMAQYAEEHKYSAFITHRSMIDYAAYALFQVPGIGINDDYIKICMRMATKYDVIAVLPMNKAPLEDDGKRHMHGTQEIEENIHKLIDLYAIPEDNIIIIESDGPVNRMNEIKDALRERGYRRGSIL